MISVDIKIPVRGYRFDLRTNSISLMTVELDFLSKKKYLFFS